MQLYLHRHKCIHIHIYIYIDVGSLGSKYPKSGPEGFEGPEKRSFGWQCLVREVGVLSALTRRLPASVSQLGL